ncbi:predicted protein [Streptomyces viridosporus ATCC 14672]|uniref:Predicted protein n=1 Tax=Streptomyces viridosporus (strain ATCC 14672 / DSM 40746 / JCM 4963 / KCTC 9882 / NRRL B-12104 / FH 1290) TaxID=566461 RepID=D6A6Y7_STRV1|nr:predicted protein [Streptomyces viridosporus ATCC 14672]
MSHETPESPEKDGHLVPVEASGPEQFLPPPSRRVRGFSGWNRGEPEGDVAPAGGVADGLGCDRGTRQRGNEMILKP